MHMIYRKGGPAAVQSLSFKRKQPPMAPNLEKPIAQDMLPNIRTVFPETFIYDSIDGNVIGYCYLLNYF